MLNKAKPSYSIRAVDNAISLLEALGEIEGEVRISHLSRKLGINKSYIWRLLATFEQRGYIERLSKPGKYRLGLPAYWMGQKFLSRMEPLRKVKPIMERLARSTNEAAYLAVPHGEEILMLHMVDTTQVVSTVPLVGQSFPVARNAAGKVILAFRAGTGVTNAKHPLPKAVSAKIQDRGTWLGYQEFGEGTACLAAPLFDRQSKAWGSLCLIGPAYRFTQDSIEENLRPALKQAANTISSQLGTPLQNLA